MVGRVGREREWWRGRGESMGGGEGGERAWVVGRAGTEHGWWRGRGESMGGAEGGERA